MTHLSETAMINWMALYAATGLCCGIASILTASVVVVSLCREGVWKDVRTLKSAALFLPRAWWRWQRLYFLSTPVTLAIVSSFGLTLSWS